MNPSSKHKVINNQDGAVALIVGICLVMFVAFSALAIDIGHLYVVRNELQNAADTGALAGARFLLTKENPSIINVAGKDNRNSGSKAKQK